LNNDGKTSDKRSRKTYYMDDDTYNMLFKMHLRTGKDMSVLLNDAIRSTYQKVSQLSEEESKELERLARAISSFFPLNLL